MRGNSKGDLHRNLLSFVEEIAKKYRREIPTLSRSLPREQGFNCGMRFSPLAPHLLVNNS